MNQIKFRCFSCGAETTRRNAVGLPFCEACEHGRKKLEFARHVLIEQRDFFINKVQVPLVKVLILLAGRVKKEPTKENTQRNNTHVWLDIRNWFLAHELNARGQAIFGALWKLFIYKNEVDDYYENRLQRTQEKWLEAVLDGKYEPRDLTYRLGDWQEEPPGRGYDFIKECYDRARERDAEGQDAELADSKTIN